MAQTATASTGKREAMLHSLAFIAGFTFVFVIAGATASAIGTIFNDYRTIITTVLGVVVILLGINMLGLFRLPFLQMDKRLRIRKPGVSYAGSVLVGIGFAAGWSPCIGPILAAVLAMASDAKTVYAAMGLLLIYSAGLAIPFFLTAFALDRALPVFKRMRRFLPAIEFIAGLFVIAMGLVLVTNKWLMFTGWIYATFPALANVGTGPETTGAISIGAVFVAGFVSFISPCVLPLVPVYISYITGQSIEQLAAA
ncbi:MAG TPA: cytochrome c biogenesis protein CcdA [Candidatus Eremiobacteraceae bacterium]|nr:cytochrome c biogenesis protein CcdA [Candidatus Eremiobacteraceae bacterium]